jgi:hypothetical protein
MTLASTSRVQMRYIKETAFGVTPVVGDGRKLRMTGESLNYDLSKEESKEIRDDRQVAGATTVDANAAGGINIHMQYAEYDELIEGALQSVFTEFGVNGVGATFTATFAPTTITASVATSGASIFTDLKLGQWFRVLAPGDADNNGLLLRVSPSVAPTTTVITLDASTPATAAVGVTNCAVQTSRLANGVTQPSFSLEKNFADITQFFLYKGMTVGKMVLNFTSAALTDGSFDFMGTEAFRDVVTAMPGTVAASQAYEIQNGVRGIGQLWEGTTPVTGTYIKSMTVNVDNTLRGQKALSNLGNVGIGTGDFKVTGQLEVYFANGTMYDKFLNDTYTQLVVATQDTDGNGYVLTLPRALLMQGKVVAGGKNQDSMLSFEYSAFSDDENAVEALRKTMFIDRVGEAIT